MPLRPRPCPECETRGYTQSVIRSGCVDCDGKGYMTMTELKAHVFGYLVQLAHAGRRAPTNDELLEAYPGCGAGARVRDLANEGWIRIEVYGRNYRVIEITRGESRGKRTAECPDKLADPYMIMDVHGRHDL